MAGDDRQPVPHERVYRRRAPGAAPQARHDHRRPARPRPNGCTRGSQTCPTCTCAIGPIPRAISARASGSASRRQPSATSSWPRCAPRTCRRGRPSAVALVPLHPVCRAKADVHPNWPSFVSERGRSIRYGAECCPKTIALHHRFAGIALDPNIRAATSDDIVAAIRKVYPAVIHG